MKKIVLIIMILTLSTAILPAIDLPNYGIEPDRWYEGFLIIEALNEIQTLTETAIEQAVEETSQEYLERLEKALQAEQEAKQKERMWMGLGIGSAVTAVASILTLILSQ